MSKIVTRFAPSPTGYLHIGGARTALFNWLYAKNQKGKFLLRIEDTDRERSTDVAKQAIFDGLNWLGLDYDGEAISQFTRIERHQEIAHQLLEKGAAYKCFSTADEIEKAREDARKAGKPTLFQSPWREAPPQTHPDAPYVIRFKAPQKGSLEIKDHVQKKVSWPLETFDDMVLLRSDGTPTYMLAVVVDDHDMGVTTIIRGDDHLINAGRQTLISHAMEWDVPEFAHIPLIHGSDGKKLSKRHGAVSVTDYRDMGYMPEAMRNYLARLGWSHGNDELFTTQQAIEWFSLSAINKSPARLDMKKLAHVSAHHIKTASKAEILKAMQHYIAAHHLNWDEIKWRKFEQALPILTERSKTLNDLLEKAQFILCNRPIKMSEEAQKKFDSVHNSILKELTVVLNTVKWNHSDLFDATKEFAALKDIKIGDLAASLRAALSGQTQTPSVFDMMEILGKEESFARINDF